MKIKVVYWAGTVQVEAFANSYRGAMKLAARNNNAYDPTFYDADGYRLHDDGIGLRREDSLVYECVDPAALKR